MRATTHCSSVVVLAIPLLALSGGAAAQNIGPEFAAHYTLTDLGPVGDVPSPYGGIAFKPGDPNTLLIGGFANSDNGGIYEIGVIRNGAGHVTGFSAAPSLRICAVTCSNGGIDGGIDFFGGVTFATTYPDNCIQEFKPGSALPDKIIPFGTQNPLGTLRVVPPNFPGAGRMKVATYVGSHWYDAALVPDGTGTYNLAFSGVDIFTGGGPEGIIYVAAGNPDFPHASVLISMYGLNQVHAFEVDANGDPIESTARVMVQNLVGAEGSVVDPVTGDFLFSTYGATQHMVRVSGFSPPCPADLNGDQVVNGADLGILLSTWGTGGAGDINQDGTTNGADLGLLLAAWGACS